MKITLNSRYQEELLEDGKLYWVCDFRYRDVRNYLPIRHVKPTEVTCRETVLTQYTIKKFENKSGRNIPIWDNVTDPSALSIFDNKEECIFHYNSLIEEYSENMRLHIEFLNAKLADITKLYIK